MLRTWQSLPLERIHSLPSTIIVFFRGVCWIWLPFKSVMTDIFFIISKNVSSNSVIFPAAKLFPSHFELQELHSGKIIGNAKEWWINTRILLLTARRALERSCYLVQLGFVILTIFFFCSISNTPLLVMPIILGFHLSLDSFCINTLHTPCMF